jgi:DNA-binding NarL/FixJ family response regulator
MSIEARSLRILVVDDFGPWCRFVRSRLQEQMGWVVVWEAHDGVEAVEKARKLHPDLIMLDISLPRVNGIEAARQIRQLAPSCKILFTSEYRSWEIAEEALRSGALGYLVKLDAGGELLQAVEAVLQGKQFISASLAGHHLKEKSRETAAFHPRPKTMVKPPVSGSGTGTVPCHEVEFYSDDQWLLDRLTRFVGSALNIGNVAIVIATASHRQELILRLETFGLDIRTVIKQGRYIALDATDTLLQFMANGRPDPIRFMEKFGNLIQTASRDARDSQRRVAVFGEGVQILLEKGNVEAAIGIEKLCNRLTQSYNVDILCGYFLGDVAVRVNDPIIQRISAEHSAVCRQ